jgi:hypothetical protein
MSGRRAAAKVDELKSALVRAEIVQGTEPSNFEDQVEKSPAKNALRLQGLQLNLADVDPWPTAVSGASVLNAVSATFRRYVVLFE